MLGKIVSLFVIVGLVMICLMVHVTTAQDEVLHIKFNNDSQYNENLNFAYDYTQKGHSANMNDIVYKTGIESECVNICDACFVEIIDHDDLTFGDSLNDKPFSVSYIYSFESTTCNILVKQWEYYCVTSNNHVKILLRDYSLSSYIAQETNIFITDITPMYDNFYLITYTYDGINVNGLKIYINGNIQDTTISASGSYIAMENTVEDLSVGSLATDDSLLIDELIIYDYELNQTQVKQLYNSYFEIEKQIILLDKNNLYNLNSNITVFENDVVLGEYNFEDTITLKNLHDYSIIIHEDISDQITNIENIDKLANENTPSILYILIIASIVGLIIYIIKR